MKIAGRLRDTWGYMKKDTWMITSGSNFRTERRSRKSLARKFRWSASENLGLQWYGNKDRSTAFPAAQRVGPSEQDQKTLIAICWTFHSAVAICRSQSRRFRFQRRRPLSAVTFARTKSDELAFVIATRSISPRNWFRDRQTEFVIVQINLVPGNQLKGSICAEDPKEYGNRGSLSQNSSYFRDRKNREKEGKG